jgi:CDP-diacylglycerol--glycerol-3-phosphate 3-phosphatidyltransferase
MYLQQNIAAFIVFLVASVSDYFDGYLARKYGQITKLGKVLDQMSDKILITSVLVVFVEWKLVPSWLVVIFVFRDTLVSIVRILASESGKVIAANIFGKLKTVFQMILTIGLYIQVLGVEKFKFLNSWLIYIVAILTIISGAIYLYQNKDFLDQ